MNKNRKLILVGGNGLIGSRIQETTQHDYVTTSSQIGRGTYHLDLRCLSSERVNFVNRDDVVLMMAGVSSPSLCESDPRLSREINFVGTKSLIDHCLSLQAKVLFFSSDTVYHETNTPVSEEEPINPEGRYAHMKAEIEDQFLGEENFKTLRLAYVVSYLDRFTSYVLSNIEKNLPSQIFHPLYRNSIWVEDVGLIIDIISNDWPSIPNLLNVGGPSSVSRIDMAQAIYRSKRVIRNYQVVEPEREFFLFRPQKIQLDISRLSKIMDRLPFNISSTYMNELKRY